MEEICHCRPDLVLLDIQMPRLGGLGVVEAVGIEAMPLVIFVTAYGEHALRAFEVHAFDYLTKPFAAGRLRAALAGARQRLLVHPDIELERSKVGVELADELVVFSHIGEENCLHDVACPSSVDSYTQHFRPASTATARNGGLNVPWGTDTLAWPLFSRLDRRHGADPTCSVRSGLGLAHRLGVAIAEPAAVAALADGAVAQPAALAAGLLA